MTIAIVQLEINGTELDAELHYTYTAGLPARLYGLPENCHPEEPAEWDLESLFIKDYADNYNVDLSELVDYIEDDLIEQLENAE